MRFFHKPKHGAVMQHPLRIQYLSLGWLEQATAIEAELYHYPWTRKDFQHVLREEYVVGIAMTHGKGLLGYVIYSCEPQQLNIINLAVERGVQRQGIATQLIDLLVKDYRVGNGCRMLTIVGEHNVGAHLFWQAQGLIVTKVLHNHWSELGEDGYLFEFPQQLIHKEPAIKIVSAEEIPWGYHGRG